jgi:MFS family permease
MQKPQSIQAIYLYLVLGNTLAASFIWGINTIFLLDAGLTNFQAFVMNGLFTAGQVIFEVVTGIVADLWGRRISYLLGAFTLSFSTMLYFFMWKIHGPLWGWAIASVLLGLGFTFFSGALEAWLVDALHATNFQGNIDTVFARGQSVGGAAMLTGSVLGGVIAQLTNLGVPYIIRSVVLLLNFGTAFFFMKDLGFTPKGAKEPLKETKRIFSEALEHGLKKPAVRWIMLAAPFTVGASFYVFYALQPFLLKLYGNPKAYGIAGLVAALVACSQIVGGFISPYVKKLFTKRTNVIAASILLGGITLLVVSIAHNFFIVIGLVFLWGLMFSAAAPIRLAYLNTIIPTEQRATILSFDSMLGSTGGIFIQPILGKVADVWSYSASYAVAAVFQFLALPFVFLARKHEQHPDDKS